MDFKIRDRKYQEKLDEQTLAPYATKSAKANKTRIHLENEHPYRTAIQRDRDRIIHSRAFRRLKHKQQVFLISEGDHYRTRLTHTLEVSQLARTLANALGLNEILVEAIALGHDLGHTPFGHVGEVVLNDILTGQDDLDGELPHKNRGGFKHNYQSLRVLDRIEKKYQFEGLNLTSYVREGILKHTRLLREQYLYPEFCYEGLHYELDSATTLESQVVAICDEIAQRTHDLEDGIRAGLVEIEHVKMLKIVAMLEDKYAIKDLLKKDRYYYRNRLIHGLINVLMDDVIKSTLINIEEFYHRKKQLHFLDEELVKFSSELNPLQLELNEFIYEEIIFKCAGNDFNNINKNMLRQLFKRFVQKPLRLPDYVLKRIAPVSHGKIDGQERQKLTNEDCFIRNIADYIAGMTDNFAKMESDKFENNK